MAGQDELVYYVKFEADQNSLNQIREELDTLRPSGAIGDGIEVATKAIMELDERLQENAETLQDYETATQKVREAGKANYKTLGDLARANAELKSEIQSAQNAMKNRTDVTDAEIEALEQLKVEQKLVNAEYNKAQREAVALQTSLDSIPNTYDELVSQNKALMAAMRSVPLDDTTGMLQSLQEQYEQNNDKLKDFDAALGNHQRNVGNYESAWGNVSEGLEGAMSKIDSSLGGVIGQGKALTGSFKGVVQGFKAGEISAYSFGKALIATGIGAIIVGIGVAVSALISAMSKLQPVMDKIEAVTSALSAGFAVLTDKVYNFITGTDEATGSIKDAMKAAYELSEANSRLRDSEIANIEIQARRRRDLQQTKRLTDDSNLSLQERIDLVDQVSAQQNQILEEDLRVARERARIARENSALARDDAEAARATAEAQAAVYQLEAEAEGLRTEMQNKRLALVKELRDAQAAAAEEARVQAEELAQMEQTLADLFLNDVELKIKSIQRQYDEYLLIAEQVGASAEDIARLRLMRDAEIEEVRTAAAVEAANRRAEAIAKAEEDIATVQRLREINTIRGQGDELLALQMEQQDREQELYESLLEEGVASDQAANLAKLQAHEEYLERRTKATKDAQKAEADLIKQTAEAEKELRAKTLATAIKGLGDAFGKTKSIAIAEALINTYQAVTNALADTKGGPVARAVSAAAALAAGLAQVRAIRKTKPQSTGGGDASSSASTLASVSQAQARYSAPEEAQLRGEQSIMADYIAQTSTRGGLTVNASLDRKGLALAVTDGQAQIETEQVTFV